MILKGCAVLLLFHCGLASASFCHQDFGKAAVQSDSLVQVSRSWLDQRVVAEEVQIIHGQVGAYARSALGGLLPPLLAYWQTSLLPLLWAVAVPVAAAALLWAWRAAVAKAINGSGQQKPVAAFLGTEALTGFRCLLTLWVFAYHMGFIALEGSGGFIVLAGTVLGASRCKEPGRANAPVRFSFCSTSILSFLAARYARIMPLYWVATIAMRPCVCHGLTTSGPWSFLRAISTSFMDTLVTDPAKVFLCVRPSGEEWFVQVILVCYLFYPALERLILGTKEDRPTRRWLLSITAGALVAKAAILAATFFLRPGGRAFYETKVPLLGALRFYSFPLFRLPDFVLGAVVPHLASSTAPYALCICSDILFLSVVAAAVWPEGKTLQMLTDLQVHGPVWAFALWGFCFAGRPSPVGRVLGRCYPTWLARTSYGIYLFQLPVASALGFTYGDLTTVLTDARHASCHRPTPCHALTIFAATVLISWTAAVLVEDSVERFVKACRT